MAPQNAPSKRATQRKRNRKRKRREVSSSSESDSSSDEDSPKIDKPAAVAASVHAPAVASSSPPSSSNSSSSQESSSSSDSEGGTEEIQKRDEAPSLDQTKTQKSARTKTEWQTRGPSPPPLRDVPVPSLTVGDPEKEAEVKAKFRQFWMANVAEAFAEDLNEIRKVSVLSFEAASISGSAHVS